MDIEAIRRRLRNEVLQVIEEHAAKGEPVRESWVVREVLSRHAPPEGADADFARLCAEQAVRKAVREALSVGRAEPEAEKQLTATEHRAAAEAHNEHAQELLRFLMKRRTARVAAGEPPEAV